MRNRALEVSGIIMKVYFNWNPATCDMVEKLNLRMSISCPNARFQFKHNPKAQIPYGFHSVMIESGGYLDGKDRINIGSYAVWLQQILDSHPEISFYLNLDQTYEVKHRIHRQCVECEYVWPPADPYDIKCQRCGKVSRPVTVDIKETTNQMQGTMKRCTDESMRNLEYLEKKGLKPVPVWHDGEDVEVLGSYCRNYRMVAVDGMGKGRRRHMTAVGPFLVSKYPKTNFHVFSSFKDIEKINFNPFSVSVSASSMNLTENDLLRVAGMKKIKFSQSTLGV
jgi:hypothetical protein